MKKTVILALMLLLILPILEAKGETASITFEEQNPVIVKINLQDRVEFETDDQLRTIILTEIFDSGRIGITTFGDRENLSHNYLKDRSQRIEMDFDRDRNKDLIVRLIGVKNQEYAVISIEDTHRERKSTIIPVDIIEGLEEGNKRSYNTTPIKIAIVVLLILTIGILVLLKRK